MPTFRALRLLRLVASFQTRRLQFYSLPINTKEMDLEMARFKKYLYRQIEFSSGNIQRICIIPAPYMSGARSAYFKMLYPPLEGDTSATMQG